MKRREFSYGERVRVTQPGQRPLTGTYYSEYRDGPGKERQICVQQPGGCGVAYPLRYVHRTKAAGQ